MKHFHKPILQRNEIQAIETCFKHPSLSPDSKEGRLGKSQKHSKEHGQWQKPERGLEGEEPNRWVISELMTKHFHQLWHWHSGTPARNMDPNVRLESKLGYLKRLQGSGHSSTGQTGWQQPSNSPDAGAERKARQRKVSSQKPWG